MKKYSYLIIIVLISSLVLTGCSLLSNIGQAPTNEQSGVSYLTKGLSSSLIGWWRFNGDATDCSGNGNDGTVYGEGTYSISPMGQALNFDGDGDYVQLPASNNILDTNTFTIEAWFKTSVNHPVYGVPLYEGRLVNLHWKDTESTAVSLYVEKDKIGLLYNTGVMAHVWVKYSVDYHDSIWHHVAVTYDATTYRLYYDGEEVASKVDDFGGFGTYPAFLGTYISSARFFQGTIDDVRIWNVALSEDQLGKVYNFVGFFPPVGNNGDVNVVKAGRAIPLKFSLDGDQGLEIFATNYYPKSIGIPCAEGDEFDANELPTVTAGESSLSYDAVADQYIYVWKTLNTWAGTCRQLELKLNDGTSHFANFTFK